MPWLQQIVLLGLIGGLALATRTTRLIAFERHQRGQRYEDIYYLPSPDSLPVLSLGYRAALADLIWCKSLVYFGTELGHRGIVKYVFAYSDAILALDPTFRSAYRWVATAALYRPTPASMPDGLHAARYLQRATERWPDDGELQWDYGSLLRFELAPLEQDKKKKQALLLKAAPYLQNAARMGAGPPWLAINNATLLNKLGQADQAIRHLRELRGTVQDPSILRDIDYQLHKLQAETYRDTMRAAQESFGQRAATAQPTRTPDLFWSNGRVGTSAFAERYRRDDR